MKKALIALTLSSLVPLSLSARTLMCEQCEPQPEYCCDEQLFVERSQCFVHGEFLYWTVEEPALDYAVKTKPSQAANTFAFGDFQINDFKYRPGFRVAVSYYRCPRYWEAWAQYTWLHDKGDDSTTAPLNPTRVTATTPPFASAQSSIDLDYHVGDLYVARVFDPNPHLRLRLYGGATGTYIDQDFKNRYTNVQGDFDQVKEQWRFWGAGLRLGLAADWFWGCQFYLTGRTSFATLAGRYENKTFQTTGVQELQIANSKFKDTRLTFNAQFLVGPSWQIPCDCWSFELFAGYEFNIWLNLQKRMISEFGPPDATKEIATSSGLLGLHGLTVRLTLGF